MSIHSFGWVMGASVSAAFMANFVMWAVLLGVAMFTTGTALNIDLLSVLPVLIGTLLGPLGIGFIIGGLTLVFKRIESYTQMVQFVLIGLVAVPAERVVWMRLLPGSFGAGLVRDIMVRGASLAEIGAGNLALLFAIGVGHLLLGYAVYKQCERAAMSQGLLGHY